MHEVYSARSASLHQINRLAEWVRENVAHVSDGKLDIIRFMEIDLPNFFPGIYISIEDDLSMGRIKARVSDDPFGILVSESVYEAASKGCLEACETLLHEAGHLFLHEKYRPLGLNDARGFYTPRIKNTNAANSAEWQAKYFAKCFMFPYSLSEFYKSSLELRVYFDLSAKQSAFVIEHWKSLRLREKERSISRDTRWLRSIVSNLRLHDCVSTQTPIAQMELFYRRNVQSRERIAVNASA